VGQEPELMGRLGQNRHAIVTHCLTGGEIVLADLMSRREERLAEVLNRPQGLAGSFHHPIDRPKQIHRRRTSGPQLSRDRLQFRQKPIADIRLNFRRAQINAIGRRNTNRRRTPDNHGLDRLGHITRSGDFNDAKLLGNTSLVNQNHAVLLPEDRIKGIIRKGRHN
jgi:hypothetical protein